MKKINILLLGVLGLFAGSCKETIEPAPPQQNEQQPIVTLDDVQSHGMLSAIGGPTRITLENFSADGATIPVIELVSTKNLPENATIEYKFELSSTSTFDKVVTLSTIPGVANEDGSNVYSVEAKDWNSAHITLFGKSPKEKEAYYRIAAYVVIDGSNYRLAPTDDSNASNYYVVSGDLYETCMDSGFVIEDHYYFLSNSTTWNIADKAEVDQFVFEHSDDVSVYDDPVFVFKFKVTQDQLDANGGGSYWKIAPESAIADQNWDGMVGTEVNGDDSLSGMLVTEHAQSGKLTEPGNYKLTINMEEMTYEFKLLLQPEVLYTPGGANGWSQTASAFLQLNSGKGYYYGVIPVDDSFKVCAEPKWDNATDYGAATEDAANSGTLVLGGTAKNIKPEANGTYWMTINYDAISYQLTKYELTKINTVGLIGSFAASGWGSDVAMTSDDNGVTWTGEIVFAANDEFKIRFNGNWDMNLGGDVKDLTLDGDNIKVADAGTYTITLSLQPGLPSLTMVKK